jgi:hypothetical protein
MMNERIQELANQMFSIEQFEYAEEFINDEFMEQFAKLVVRECCDVLHDNEMGGYRVNYVLKEHFGVEE